MDNNNGRPKFSICTTLPCAEIRLRRFRFFTYKHGVNIVTRVRLAAMVKPLLLHATTTLPLRNHKKVPAEGRFDRWWTSNTGTCMWLYRKCIVGIYGSHYSTNLVRVTQALLASSPEKSDGGGIRSIRQLYSVSTDRMFSEIKIVPMNELSKETENRCLLVILVNPGIMNERPENDMDPGWSETGDRYLLKHHRKAHQLLIRGHVIECLNKGRQ